MPISTQQALGILARILRDHGRGGRRHRIHQNAAQSTIEAYTALMGCCGSCAHCQTERLHVDGRDRVKLGCFAGEDPRQLHRNLAGQYISVEAVKRGVECLSYSPAQPDLAAPEEV